jgi:hypothetical protein
MTMMKFGKAYVSRGFGTAVILLSPLWFIGTVLIAIAVGHDVFRFSGEVPIALSLTAPAAYLVVRWAAPAARARLIASFHLARVAAAGD